MKCVYCLEEMNDGASVCKVCTREQPKTEAQQAAHHDNLIFYGLGALLLGLLIAVAIWLTAESWGRESAVNKIVDCLHSKGDSAATASFVNYEIDDAMEQTGKGWRASLVMAAMFTSKNLNPQWGVCYISPDNIISEMKGE